MAVPVLDPNLPADNSPIVSAELRGQFGAIQNALQSLSNRITAIDDKLLAIGSFSITVSDPPTQAEVQAIGDTLDNVISGLRS